MKKSDMLVIIEHALMGTGIPLDSAPGVAKSVLMVIEANEMLPPTYYKKDMSGEYLISEWEPEDT